MACHCNEFSRAHLLRQSVAQAGNGLPAIEPGMPIPAGTGLSRRSFLMRSGIGMLSVYGASKLGLRQLQEGIAGAAGANDPILVTVFLDGGADALSILAPVGDSRYSALRPTLALSNAQTVPLNGYSGSGGLRWNKNAQGLATLHDANKVTVFPAIGYAHPDQSHFTSRHYWEVGELDPDGRTGWLGRLIDVIGTNDNPLQGLSLDGSLSPSLATARKPVAAIDGNRYDLDARGVYGPVGDYMYDALDAIGSAHLRSKDAGRKTAGVVQKRSSQLRGQLESFAGDDDLPAGYPDTYFSQNLSGLATMLAAGLPIRCVALTASGGYDTHDGEEGSFPDDIKDSTDALLAFQTDLEARGLAGRVLTLVWSEFGRRPEENGSRGTDHGAAGNAFLIGSKAQPAVIGDFPGLGANQLDQDDNVRNTSDFRTIYRGLIDQWFGADPTQFIPEIPAGSLGVIPTLVKP